MGTTTHIADLIDEHAYAVEVKRVDEQFGTILVTAVGREERKHFSMMKGIFHQITRETGMMLSAIDGSAGGEHDTRLWFSEPEIGVRDLS